MRGRGIAIEELPLDVFELSSVGSSERVGAAPEDVLKGSSQRQERLRKPLVSQPEVGVLITKHQLGGRQHYFHGRVDESYTAQGRVRDRNPAPARDGLAKRLLLQSQPLHLQKISGGQGEGAGDGGTRRLHVIQRT